MQKYAKCVTRFLIFFIFLKKNKKSVPIETKKNLYRNRKLFL